MVESMMEEFIITEDDEVLLHLHLTLLECRSEQLGHDQSTSHPDPDLEIALASLQCLKR
jgi:hypothetical protein